MSRALQLTDALLAEALSRRADHAPSPLLLDRIVTAAASVPQDRPAGSWLGGGAGASRPTLRLRLAPLAGALTAAVLIALFASILLPPVGPGESPSPSPSPTPRPSPTVFVPTVTPEAVLVGEAPALRLQLGNFGSAGPNDVFAAFDSIWVANMFAREVRRLDPGTMRTQARITVDGPGWFAATDDAVWATNQGGAGVSRIDPATNTVVDVYGDGPACGAPVVALGAVWVSACDADEYYRVDLATSTLRVIPAQGRSFIAVADGQLVVQGERSLDILDPELGTFGLLAAAPGDPGMLLGADAGSLWVLRDGNVEQLEAATGATTATFAYPDAVAVSFSGSRAWLTVRQVGVVEIDLVTDTAVRTIPLTNSAHVAREAEGFLWVTDFANDRLWRIEP